MCKSLKKDEKTVLECFALGVLTLRAVTVYIIPLSSIPPLLYSSLLAFCGFFFFFIVPCKQRGGLEWVLPSPSQRWEEVEKHSFRVYGLEPLGILIW